MLKFSFDWRSKKKIKKNTAQTKTRPEHKNLFSMVGILNYVDSVNEP